MNILHVIANNNSKFHGAIVGTFEKTSHHNKYVCIVDDGEDVKCDDSDRVVRIKKSECGFLWDKEDFDAYMFHPLYVNTYDWVLQIPRDKIVIASSWGADLYYPQANCPPLLSVELYRGETRKAIRSINERRSSLLDRVRRTVGEVYHYNRNKERSEAEQKQLSIKLEKQQKVLQRINLWATVLPEEFGMLKSKYGITAKPFPFHYAVWNLSLDCERPVWEDTNCILLGNSADPTNNHIDLVRLMQKRGIIDRYSLYIPLAYGDEKYKNWLKTHLGLKADKFIAQDELIPIEEYRKILKSCRVAVFGHLRQQALGNIIENMLQGKKVFLYKDSMAYKYFIGRGAIVYNIEQDLCLNEIDTQLTEKQIEINKKACDEFAVENVVSRVGSALSSFKRTP